MQEFHGAKTKYMPQSFEKRCVGFATYACMSTCTAHQNVSSCFESSWFKLFSKN